MRPTSLIWVDLIEFQMLPASSTVTVMIFDAHAFRELVAAIVCLRVARCKLILTYFTLWLELTLTQACGYRI